MSAFLTVPEFPATVEFVNMTAAEVAPVLLRLIENGRVIKISTSDDHVRGDGVHILLNCRLMNMVTLTDNDPLADVRTTPLIRFEADVDALMGLLDD